MLDVLPTHGGKGTIWQGVIDTKEAVKMGLDTELARYKHLRSLQKKQNRRNISGHLDMILWNTIHADQHNILQDLFHKYLELEKSMA